MPEDERTPKPVGDDACGKPVCPRCGMPVEAGTIRCPRCFQLLLTACSGGCVGCGKLGCAVRRED